VRLSELSYELPAELIARYPAGERDESRLMIVREGEREHARFRDIEQLLPQDALLVVNDTRVLSARLFGRKAETGGKVEVLLVERRGPSGPVERWEAMVRSSRKLREGTALELGASLRAVVEQAADERGLFGLRLEGDDDVSSVVAEIGHVPLPPYLGREDEPSDLQRYQTVYAKHPGAVAAPTAGLHFSDALLARLHERGIELARLTLHVGPGTFKPVTTEDLSEHPMHAERFELSQDTASRIADARRKGRRIVAVGTTVVRALETAADPELLGHVRATSGETRLLIQPGFRFRVVDELITNFHLPGSTLLALVYAFAGANRVADAYRDAIAQRYRFYSYGDAMYFPQRDHG
jgi:S-adenosylmethionine:tRNA ribosyltransferase-isomerase